MTSRRVLTLIALATVVTAVFAGGAREAQQPEGPERIIFYMWEDPTYIDIVNAFNESQDEIFVDAQILPNADYETRLTTLLAGGAEMDAFMQKRAVDMFGHFAAGHIEPLDALIDRHDYDLDAVSSFLSAIQIDGQTVGIPFRGATYYTYFNKRLFDAAGVPYPSEYVEAGDWTWERFIEVSGLLTSDEVYGSQIHPWALLQVIPAIQNQVDFIDNDGTIDIDDSVIESFRIRRALEERGHTYPLLDLLTTRVHYSNLFFDEEIAMMLIGEWFPGMMINARREGTLAFDYSDWGITRLPSDTSPYRSIGAPTFNHVHARSGNKDAAFRFIAWMGSEAGAEVVARAGFLPPLMTPTVEDALRDAMPDEESFAYFTEGPEVYPQFYTRYGSRVNGILVDLMGEYLISDWSDAELERQIMTRLEDIVATTD